MVFIETTLFTKLLPSYLEDHEYLELQQFLVDNPSAGAVIQGTGGLRKLRWVLRNKGKRGGVRAIYYWQAAEDSIYLFTLYAKNEASDLSPKEKKILKLMLEEL